VIRRFPLLVVLGFVLAAGMVLPAAADAQARVRPRVAARATVVIGRPYYRPYLYDPWYPYGYWYPYDYYGPRNYYYDDTASLRIQATPRQTQVYVDGYYAGLVDDFDGTFQRLRLEPGEHDVQLYLPGHRPVTQRIYLQPRTTFRIREALVPLAPGEPEPLPPSGSAPAAQRATPPRDRRSATAPPRGTDIVSTRGGDYGSLAIRVQPGDALVLIDGERWDGSAGDDRLVVQLAPGAHHIEVRKDGYRSYMTEVAVRAGETAPLNIALARQ
jgi:hypothetical protein